MATAGCRGTFPSVSGGALDLRAELRHERVAIRHRELAREALADEGGGAALRLHPVLEELDGLERGTVVRRRDREDVVRQEARRGDLRCQGTGAPVPGVADDGHFAG